MAIARLKPLELFVRRLFLRSLRVFAGKQKTVPIIPESPAILLLRQDRLGDLLMSSFFLVALHEKFLNASFGIVVGKNNEGGFPLLPVRCEKFLYTKNPLQDLFMLRKIRKRKFDLAIDLTDKASVTSSVIMALSGAKVRLGVAKENSSVYTITVPQFSQYSRHVTERVAEMLRPLGIDPASVDKRPVLAIPVKKIPGRVGMNVSARTAERSAPAPAMAEIARGILELGFIEVLVFSAPDDRNRGAETVRLANDQNIRETSRTSSFLEFAEQVASCEYLITVDTSITQIAGATGIPTLLLLRSEIDQFPWFPIGTRYEVYRQSPDLTALEPQPVIALFRQLLEQTSKHVPKEIIHESVAL